MLHFIRNPAISRAKTKVGAAVEKSRRRARARSSIRDPPVPHTSISVQGYFPNRFPCKEASTGLENLVREKIRSFAHNRIFSRVNNQQSISQHQLEFALRYCTGGSRILELARARQSGFLDGGSEFRLGSRYCGIARKIGRIIFSGRSECLESSTPHLRYSFSLIQKDSRRVDC